jgi:hypothetical protein
MDSPPQPVSAAVGADAEQPRLWVLSTFSQMPQMPVSRRLAGRRACAMRSPPRQRRGGRMSPGCVLSNRVIALFRLPAKVCTSKSGGVGVLGPRAQYVDAERGVCWPGRDQPITAVLRDGHRWQRSGCPGGIIPRHGHRGAGKARGGKIITPGARMHEISDWVRFALGATGTGGRQDLAFRTGRTRLVRRTLLAPKAAAMCRCGYARWT